MSVDISKLFQKMLLHPEDSDLHRYAMKNEAGLFKKRRMTRVTFGVTYLPFLASQVHYQVPMDHQQEFPEAVALIKSSFVNSSPHYIFIPEAAALFTSSFLKQQPS